MVSILKMMFGYPVKQLTCCISSDPPKQKAKPAEAEGFVAMMRRKWNSEDQFQEDLAEERRQRDAFYAQKKAERAVMRDHFREKYQLPKNQTATNQRRTSKATLSKDVAALVRTEEPSDSEMMFFGALPNIQNMDLSFLRKSSQSTIEALRPGPQCLVM